MSSNTQTNFAACPECEEQIPVPQPLKMGKKISCPNCWAYLEVTKLTPLQLSWDVGELEYEDIEDDL